MTDITESHRIVGAPEVRSWGGTVVIVPLIEGRSTTRIGRFYNGRHHTTVLHAIAKIERLRQTDETLDALMEVLTAASSPTMEGRLTQRFERGWSTRGDVSF